jgi:hypothetical protein
MTAKGDRSRKTSSYAEWEDSLNLPMALLHEPAFRERFGHAQIRG